MVSCKSQEKMGSLNFEIKFAAGSENPAKAVSHTFSSKLFKLYANIKKSVPITFVVDDTSPSDRCFIRVTPQYQLVEYTSELIQRCPTHTQDGVHGNRFITVDTGSMPIISKYFYAFDSKGRVSLSVELPPQTKTFTITYHFNCLSSCKKGIRRRDMKLLFELVSYYDEIYETIHSSIGVPLVVATCPGRDRARDERRLASCKQETVEVKKEEKPPHQQQEGNGSKTSDEYDFVDDGLAVGNPRKEEFPNRFWIEVDDEMTIEFIKTFCRGLEQEV